ncbi:MAG: DUF2191 domain-containing protein [Alphaproteobacteria bacterium]|nr:DUF2191 domain-containing protein [Alphaproteobacteria bacterium]
MRTTLTIDEDVAVRLKRLRKARDISLKDLINDALRRGLDAAEKPPAKRKPFRTKTFDAGKPLFDSPEELKALMNRLQWEEDMRKLGMK